MPLARCWQPADDLFQGDLGAVLVRVRERGVGGT